MLYAQQQPIVIPTGASGTSPTLELSNHTLVGVYVTATHTADINILAGCDSGSFVPLRNSSAAITIDATSGAALYALSPLDTYGIKSVQFQSAGNEVAPRTIYPVYRQID